MNFLENNLFNKCKKDNYVLVFGHRGYSGLYPENTMISFDECGKLSGVDGVELDVHLCKSGEVVVAHDFSLKRTAGLDVEIEELTWDEIKKIDVGSFKDPSFSYGRIPLLEELFSTMGNRFVYDVELKVKSGHINKELSIRTLDLIKKYKLEERVMVSSFNPLALRTFGRIAKTNPVIGTADIFDTSKSIPKILQQGQGHLVSHSTYLKPRYDQVNEEFLSKHKDLPIMTWTVNTKEEGQSLIELNKDNFRVYGLIGNYPDVLVKAREERLFDTI